MPTLAYSSRTSRCARAMSKLRRGDMGARRVGARSLRASRSLRVMPSDLSQMPTADSTRRNRAHHPTEDKPVSPYPVRTCSTYVFKGALRAPGPGLVVHARAPRDNGADCRAAQRPPIAGWPPEDRGAPGAGCLPLAPSGHVGAGAHSPPATGHMGSAPQRQRWRAGRQTGPSLRRPHSQALRARGQDRSLTLASLRDPFGPLDRSAAGIQGRLSEGWPGPSATPPVAAVGSSRPGLSRLIAVIGTIKVHVTRHPGHIGRTF